MKNAYKTTVTLAGAGAIILAGAVALVSHATAHAQASDGETEAAIKYRQNVMSIMGGATGAIVGQLRDGFEYGPDLQAVADVLVAASSDIPALFPEGTDSGETDALPEVWSDRQGFEEDASTLHKKTQAFAETVGSGDRAQMLKAFKEVGDACKSCHEDYREED